MGNRTASMGRLLFDNFEELIATLLLVVIGVSMMMQIVSRGILNNPLGWPEMLSQMLLIWASVLGAVGAAKRWALVRMESLLNSLPQQPRRLAEWIGLVAVCVLLVMLAWKGTQLAQRISTVAHPLPVTWAWGYAAAPVFSVLMLVRLFQIHVLSYRFVFVEAPGDAGLAPAGEAK